MAEYGVDLDEIARQARNLARKFELKNESGPNRREQNENAFAHAYGSAVIGYDNPAKSWMLGEGRELWGFMSGSYRALTGDKNYDLSGVWLDGQRDRFNNYVGNQIAWYAKQHGLPKEAIPYLVADAVRTGQLITNEFNDKRVGSLPIGDEAAETVWLTAEIFGFPPGLIDFSCGSCAGPLVRGA